jgi:hypothetical protein
MLISNFLFFSSGTGTYRFCIVLFHIFGMHGWRTTARNQLVIPTLELPRESWVQLNIRRFGDHVVTVDLVSIDELFHGLDMLGFE